MSDPPLAQVPHPHQAVTVLAAGQHTEDHAALRGIIDHSNWQLHSVSNCQEALSFLDNQPAPVVICERDVPDGGWQECLNKTSLLTAPPKLIVSCRLADERLWAEVLNLGAYDLLATPFEAMEVLRVMHLAWIAWNNEQERRLPHRKAPGLEQVDPAHSRRESQSASGGS